MCEVNIVELQAGIRAFQQLIARSSKRTSNPGATCNESERQHRGNHDKGINRFVVSIAGSLVDLI